MRFAAFMMEEGVKKTEALGSEKICVIYDREGMTRQNIDFSMFGVLQSLLGMVQDFYAERLGAVYVLHANWLYHAIFGMLKPVLTERTKSKMKLLGSPAELGEYFELDQLPEYYREACERGGGLSHLRQRQCGLLHACAAGGADDDDGFVFFGAQLDGAGAELGGRLAGEEVAPRAARGGRPARTLNHAGGLQVVHGARVHHVAHGEALDGLILRAAG